MVDLLTEWIARWTPKYGNFFKLLILVLHLNNKDARILCTYCCVYCIHCVYCIVPDGNGCICLHLSLVIYCSPRLLSWDDFGPGKLFNRCLLETFFITGNERIPLCFSHTWFKTLNVLRRSVQKSCHC